MSALARPDIINKLLFALSSTGFFFCSFALAHKGIFELSRAGVRLVPLIIKLNIFSFYNLLIEASKLFCLIILIIPPVMLHKT